MAEVGSLFVRLRADASEFEETMAGIGGQFKGAGKGMQQAGGTLTKGVTAPLLGIAGAAVAVGMGFDQQMSKVQALSGATEGDLAAMRDTALDLGASTTYSAKEAAEGMEYLSLGGLDANQVMAAMPGLLSLAAAEQMGMGQAAEIAAGAMKLFGISGDDAGMVADQMIVTSTNAAVSVGELGEALKMGGPAASAAGMSFAETNGVLGMLADGMLKGSIGGTTLSAMLRDLEGNVEDGAVSFGDFAVDMYDAQGQMRPFGDIMHDIESATSGMTDEQRNAALSSVFQAQSIRGVNVMLAQGMGRYDDLTGSIEDSTGAAKAQADMMTNNLAGAFSEVRSATEGVLIQLSDALTPLIRDTIIPVVQGFIGSLSRLVGWFGNLNPTIQKVVLIFLGIIAAIGPLLVIFGTLGIMIGGAITAFGVIATVMGVVLSPIGLIVLAIAALVVGLVILYKKSETFRDIVNGAFEAVGKVVGEVVGLVKDLLDGDWSAAWDRASGWVTSARDAIKDVLPKIWDAISGFITETIPKIAGKLGGWASEFVSWIGPQIEPMLAELYNLLGSLIDWLVTSALPGIIENLAKWGAEFIAWVAPQIPPLLEALGGLLVDIGEWIITTGVPTLVEKLVEWGGAFLGFIAKDVLPYIVEKLGVLLTDVASWIVDTAAPELVTKLKEWGGAFLGWVAKDVLPFIVAKLSELSTMLLKWVTEVALPKIVKKLSDWASAFVDWVADSVKDLPEKLKGILETIETWATDNLESAGKILKDIGGAIIGGLIDGISGKFEDLKGILGEATDLIPDWKGPMSKDRKLLRPTGMVIMEGLERGLDMGAAGVERRLNQLTGDLSSPTVGGTGAGASGAPIIIRNEIGGRVVDEYIIDVNNLHSQRTYG